MLNKAEVLLKVPIKQSNIVRGAWIGRSLGVTRWIIQDAIRQSVKARPVPAFWTADDLTNMPQYMPYGISITTCASTSL